jgi:hypothetical protein
MTLRRTRLAGTVRLEQGPKAHAEAAFDRNDFAFIDRLRREWSPGYELPAAEHSALKEALRGSGVLTETLAY